MTLYEEKIVVIITLIVIIMTIIITVIIKIGEYIWSRKERYYAICWVLHLNVQHERRCCGSI